MLYFVLYFVVFFLLLIFLIVASIFMSGLIYSILNGAPYVPTNKDVLDEILKRLKLKKGKKMLELGCGTGRIIATAVEKYHISGTGVEINPLLYFGALLRKKFYKLTNLTFIRDNVLKIPFIGYDVIYLYLFPSLIEKIEGRIRKECKKGTIIVSHGFRIPGLSDKLYDTLEGYTFKTFFYRI